MGYSTDHVITVERQKDGSFVIIDNEYDDEMFVGTGESYYQAPREEVSLFIEEMTYEEAKAEQYNQSAATRASIANTTLDSIAVATYADRWVNSSASGGQNTSYYNTSKYGYFNADCANYVSQCLEAGGMSYESGSGYSGWWFNSAQNKYPNANVDATAAEAWRYVPTMASFFKGKGFSEASASSSNIRPGHIVTSGSNGHVVICVGYNSSGTPIVNSHNGDRYHVAYSFFGTSKVIQLATDGMKAPSSSTVITATTSTKTASVTVSNSSVMKCFKITPTSTGYYTFYSSGSSTVDPYAYFYETGKNNIVFLKDRNDDGGTGNHFRLRVRLTAGKTYYLGASVCPGTLGGSYTLHYLKG